jgi:hypothetical protein
MATEASYVIFTDGTTVYARNGLTGAIEFSDTNASKVIQEAIDTVGNMGRIFIKKGTYMLSTGLIIPQGAYGIMIDGEGYGTIIGTLNNIPMITISPWAYIIQIKNLFLSLNVPSYSNAAITLNGNNPLIRIQGINIKNWAGDSSGTGIKFITISTNQFFYNDAIDDVVITDMNIAVEVDVNTSGSWANANFINNLWIGCKKGIVFKGGAANWIVKNVIMESGTPSDVMFDFSEAGSAGMVFEDCIMYDAPVGAKLFNLSAGVIDLKAKRCFNSYVKSENSGTASYTGSSKLFTVSHGLLATPKIVTITPQQSGQGKIWVTNKNAATFTINFDTAPSSSTWYFDWYAEV